MGKKKRRSGKRSGNRKKTRRRTAPAIKTLYRSEDASQWIHKGRRGIIISRDSTGTVRAMVPYTGNPNSGQKYAEAINAYAKALSKDSVRIYSLIAPSQGEYYMPEMTSTAGAEQRAIEATARALDSSVTPVFVNDTMKNHLSEEIYNRTDHHWSPLGAFYASKALARAAGVGFRKLSEYDPKTVKDYVGTMHKFSGDQEVKKAPEEFVYFLPPAGYRSEFITYRLSGGRTVSESLPHPEDFFKNYPDGSGAAYCTFMGGDTRTVKVTNTGGTPGRKLLIVKDSFGNAMASCLFGSFEEVHVVDFRYFPHNLTDYVRRNNITDMVFVNCVSLAFAPNTASRLMTMLNARSGSLRPWSSATFEDHSSSSAAEDEVSLQEEENTGEESEETEGGEEEEEVKEDANDKGNSALENSSTGNKVMDQLQNSTVSK